MERKMNVADFAALVGTTSKTIYQKITNFDELPVNERLLTVKEKVKGRETTLIVTTPEQILFYQNLYGKNTVNEGEYYEILTENNGYKPVNNSEDALNNSPVQTSAGDFADRLLRVNEEFNDRYEQKITELLTLHKELAEVKGRQLLLEDKASREGLYINEINELKTNNKELLTFNERLKYVIIGLIMVIMGLIMYFVMVNNLSQPVNNVSETVTNGKKPAGEQEVVTPPAPQQGGLRAEGVRSKR